MYGEFATTSLAEPSPNTINGASTSSSVRSYETNNKFTAQNLASVSPNAIQLAGNYQPL